MGKRKNKKRSNANSQKVNKNLSNPQKVNKNPSNPVSSTTKVQESANMPATQERIEWSKWITDRKWLCIALPLLLCVLVYVFAVKVVPNMSVFCKDFAICEPNEQERTNEDELKLKNEVLIVQDFEMPCDAMSGVDVYFKRAEGNAKGKIKIQLMNEHGEEVYNWQVREDMLEEDAFRHFSMNSLTAVSRGSRYTLRIYSADNDDAAAKVVTSAKDEYAQGSLFVDGKLQDKDLMLKVTGKCDGASQKYIFNIIFAGMAVLITLCFYMLTQKKVSSYMQSISWLDWLLVGVAGIGTALLFSQYSDLELTIKHSEDLISVIKDGKMFQYYDIVLNKALNGGYGQATPLNAANYNIFLYLALSIIIFPWVLIKKLFEVQYEYYAITMYVQCVLFVLDLAAAYLLSKVCSAFGADKKHAKLVSYLFLSSSITLFATTGFGQLDIIYIIVMLWAVLFFARQQYYRFSLVMSVAIMLKSFPIMIFVPMILLTNKKVWKILVNMILGLSSSLLFKVTFGSAAGYVDTKAKMDANYDFMGRLVKCNIENGFSTVSIFVVLYVILCIWAYSKRVDSKDKLYTHFIWIGLFVFGSFALLTFWHPQWLVILSLFIALAVPQFANSRLALYCDLGIQIMYLLVSNMAFQHGVDNYMMNRGILFWTTHHGYTGISILQLTDIIQNALPIVVSLFVGILSAFIYHAYKQIDRPRLAGEEITCERLLVWVRLAVMYAYCLMLCEFYFYLG